MGRGNVCTFGKYEGLYYVSSEDFDCFSSKVPDADGVYESRLLRDIGYEEFPEWEYDEFLSADYMDEVLDTFKVSFSKRFKSFEPCDKWISEGFYRRSSKHAILENKVFYIAIEDNESSLAFELIQKEPEWDYDFGWMHSVQKRNCQKYLNGVRDSLLEQFDTIYIRNGAWMQAPLTREVAACGGFVSCGN